MYKLHCSCRACGNNELMEVFDLGVQPLANDFQNCIGEHAGFAPLKVLFCPVCTLAQLSVVVNPKLLYSNYSYVTGTSAMMKAHFGRLWDDIRNESEAANVVEIGSNTGDFLAYAKENGASSVLGVDPAENLAEQAASKNVDTLVALFDLDSANKVHSAIRPDVVVARHVFCHIDDWKEFIEALELIGHSETLYVIEVPYAPDTLKIHSWDQIYHEHLSFFNLLAMEALLKGTGLHIHKTVKYTIHGGAIAVMLRRNESKVHPELVLHDVMLADDWLRFAKTARRQQHDLKSIIERLVELGHTVAGFGASAKSTVWINACGLTRKHLKFICDSTPQKQGKFSPGTDIPVYDEGALLRESPNFAVCFAWNFMDDILKSQSAYTENGGKFIVPLPELRIVP